MDSDIRNFDGDDPFPSTNASRGQINVYNVVASVTQATTLRFDLYDHDVANKNGKVNYLEDPGSHDAGAGVKPKLEPPNNPVPEPATLAMALSGLAAFGLVGLRRLRRRANAAA